MKSNQVRGTQTTTGQTIRLGTPFARVAHWRARASIATNNGDAEGPNLFEQQTPGRPTADSTLMDWHKVDAPSECCPRVTVQSSSRLPVLITSSNASSFVTVTGAKAADGRSACSTTNTEFDLRVLARCGTRPRASFFGPGTCWWPSGTLAPGQRAARSRTRSNSSQVDDLKSPRRLATECKAAAESSAAPHQVAVGRFLSGPPVCGRSRAATTALITDSDRVLIRRAAEVRKAQLHVRFGRKGPMNLKSLIGNDR